MDLFTIELVFNASSQPFPNKTLSSIKKLLPEQVNLDGQWEVAISEICYPSRYHNITEGKFMFYDGKLSKTTEAYYLETGLYSSITDIVEAMNTLIQDRNNHRDTCITIKDSRVTQKVKVYLTNKDSSLVVLSTDLEPMFGGDMGNDFGNTPVWETTASTNFRLRYCSHPFTHDLCWQYRVQYCWRQKGGFAPLLFIHIQAQIWWHNNYWTIHELSDF